MTNSPRFSGRKVALGIYVEKNKSIAPITRWNR